MAYAGGIFRHVSTTLLGYGGQLVLTLLAAILSAQLLGPHARGELAAIQMMTLTLMAASSFGSPQAATFYTAREPQRAGDFLGSRIVLNLLSCIPFILLGLGMQAYLLEDYRPVVFWVAVVYLIVMLPGLSLFGAPTNTFLALKDYGRFTIMGILGSAVYVVAIASAFLWAAPELVASVYMLLVVLGGIPLAVWMYTSSVKLPVRFHWADLRMMFGYAAFSFLSTLPQVLGQRLDQLVVLARLDAASLGLYTIAAGVGQMFQTLQLAAGNILLPYLAGNERDNAAKVQMFGQVVRVTFVLSFILVLALLVVLPVLVPLMFGVEFASAIPAAALLIAGAALQGINITISEGLRGLNLPKLPLYTEIVGVGVKAVALAAVVAHGITMELAAATVILGALGALVANMVLYHVKVEPLSFGWLLRTGDDVRLIVEHVSARGRVVIRNKLK